MIIAKKSNNKSKSEKVVPATKINVKAAVDALDDKPSTSTQKADGKKMIRKAKVGICVCVCCVCVCVRV